MRSNVTQSALAEAMTAYEADGAAVLRGVLALAWIDLGRTAVDRIMARQTDGDFNAPGEARFFNGTFTWLQTPEIKSIIFESGLAEIAAQVMGSAQVRFFYDQVLVKEPGAAGRTPWHQDLSYWPASGEQIMSIWIPFDRATPENGVVTYVKGSHRWKALYRAARWMDPRNPFAEREAVMGRQQQELPTLPDIQNNPDRYDLVSWELEPGDVILHHPLTVHGAPGNTSPDQRRRALSLRWLGDDARWDDTHSHFLRIPQLKEAIKLEEQVQGEPFRGDTFPLVWSRAIAA